MQLPALLRALALLAAVAAPLLTTEQASAQTRTYELSESYDWTLTDAPAPGSEEWTIAEGRRLLAQERFAAARREMARFLDQRKRRGDPPSAAESEALLILGDAKVAMGDEFKALYDYERLIREYPASPAFERAIEREIEIALLYANGLRRKAFGLRLFKGDDIAVELLIRVQERMPGSQLAERAAIELADYYYKKREIDLASESYELYILNFPKGPNAERAARRRIYADIARFKGPQYDSSGLLDAKIRARNYWEQYPADAERNGINRALVTRLDESLAATMLDSADWYLTVNQDASAKYTLNRLIDRYPNTNAAQRATEILTDKGWSTPPADAETAEQATEEQSPQDTDEEASTDQEPDPAPSAEEPGNG